MTVDTTLPRLIVIVGPTAVGKTALALTLAEQLGGEIISADSMQVYRHMDIGTAKPAAGERARVRHHLLDVVEPDEPFNAARFVDLAAPIIRALHEKKKPILIVGGTGLYIRALLGGLFLGPAADEELRNHYRRQMDRHGREHLHRELERIDCLAARRIYPHDAVRVIRALEVMTLTGRSIVESQAEHGFLDRAYQYLKIGLTIERPALYEKIDERTRAMVEAGLGDEVRGLLALGYGEDLKPMQSMGYKHILPYLKGSIDLEEAVRLTARDTRRYAKRQQTWFGADAEVEWHTPNESGRIAEIIRHFLARDSPEFA